MKVKYEDIVYLDTEFLYSKYEELTGKKAIVSLSKTEGGNAGLNIPVLSGRISTRTTKCFKTSPETALSKLIKDFRKIPKLGKNESEEILVWISGNMSIGEWVNKKNNIQLDNEEVIEIKFDERLITLLYILVTNKN
jgi:hypothetical protein